MRIFHRTLLLMLTFVFVVGTYQPNTYAAFYDGNELHEVCMKHPRELTGYAMGATDALKFYNEEAVGQTDICFTGKVKAGQIRDVICKFLKENPALRGEFAPKLVFKALKQSFPCE